jgi:hypothetical protein
VNGGTRSNGHNSSSPPVPEIPICLSFKVFLVNAKTNGHSEEWRQLRFFFHPTTPGKSNGVIIHEEDKMTIAQSFFRDLVNPIDFPANYVGYIMKIMKLMQMKHHSISKMEVEMKLLRELAELPSRPSEYHIFYYSIVFAPSFLSILSAVVFLVHPFAFSISTPSFHHY